MLIGSATMWPYTYDLKGLFLFFFTQSANFPIKVFWSRFDPKRDYKMVNESSKVNRLWDFVKKKKKMAAAYNITLTRPTRDHHPPTFNLFNVNVSPSQSTLDLVDQVSLWLTPPNTNIGTFYFSLSTTIRHPSDFQKLNFFLSIQRGTFSSQFHRHF